MRRPDRPPRSMPRQRHSRHPDRNLASAACARRRSTCTTPARTSGSRSCKSCFCWSTRSSVMRAQSRWPCRVALSVVARPSLASARCSTYPFRTRALTTRLVVLLSRNSRSANALRRSGTVLDERLERVALRHRDVVAADTVAVAKLIDADKIGDRLVQGERVAVERRLLGIRRWCRARHCCY